MYTSGEERPSNAAMSSPTAGFQEIEHTADWAIRVWAPTLAELFEQAARGMYALAGLRGKESPRRTVTFELEGEDPEELLVGFLSELLYQAYVKGLVFDRFELTLDQNHLTARLEGTPVASYGKEIKAVTYHDLAIRQRSDGLLETIVVFDV